MCIPSVIFAPTFGLTGVIFTGQSLGNGFDANPSIFTTPVGPALQLWDPTNAYTGTTGLVLRPLVEVMRAGVSGTGVSDYPANMGGDSGMGAFCAQMHTFATGLGGDWFPFVATNVALGGATMLDVSSGGARNAYASMVYEGNRIKPLATANGYTFGYGLIVLVNGEADVTNVNFGTQIQAFATSSQTDLKAVTGQSQAIPVLLVQVASLNQGISLLQQNTVTNDSTIFMVGPAYQWPYTAGGLHHTAAGYEAFAEKTAQAYFSILQGTPWKCLREKTVARSGTTVTLTLEGGIGNVQIDGSFAPSHQITNTQWANGCGFEFSDNSGTVGITSISVTGARTIQINLASTPGASPKLAYAWTADGGANHAGTVNGQRGLIHDSDTTSLRSGAQFNWLRSFQVASP